MIELPLRLVHDGEPGAAAAWFVPGAEPALWLDELCRWSIPLEEAELYVLPVSASDRAAGGVLVLTRQQPHATLRAMPYRCLAGALYLPAGARLDPVLSEEEIRERWSGRVVVWHPGVGLIGFDPEDRLEVHQLLSGPPDRGARWDRARPGVVLAPRLVSVVPAAEELPDVEVILESGRDDIGSEPLEDVPGKGSGEGAGGPGFGVAVFVARLGIGLFKRLPESRRETGDPGRPASPPAPADERPPGGGLWLPLAWRNWFAKVARVARQDERHRELERLLRLLDDDPDEALRYAPAIRGDDVRGLAPPSNRLSPTDPTFDLARLGGGRPGDPWSVDAATRWHLEISYRQLAARERSLGRHRRAAYIYAELLGDYQAAAEVLEEGGHHREAAVLFIERVKDPRRAARCLEAGGLLEEAALLYEQVGEFRSAADLYRRLERLDEAHRLYRLQVKSALEKRDHLLAAELLEKELEAPDEALEVLDSAWPRAPQAKKCLEEELLLLGRLTRHQESLELLHSLRNGRKEGGTPSQLCGALVGPARNYPASEVRRAATDLVRVVVGRTLSAGYHGDSAALLRALRSVEPADALLRRDAARYQQQLQKKRAALLGTISRPPRRVEPAAFLRAIPLRRVLLPPVDRWIAADSTSEALFLAGLRKGELVVVRSPWSGPPVELTWPDLRLSGMSSFQSLTAGRAENPVLLLAPKGPKRPEMKKFPGEGSSGSWTAVGQPDWFAGEPVGLAYAEDGTLHGLQWNQKQLELCEFAPPRGDDPLRSTRRRAIALEESWSIPAGVPTTAMIVHAGAVYFAMVRQLFRFSSLRGLERLEVGWVSDLAAVPEQDAVGVAAALSEGGVRLFRGTELANPIPLARDLTEAVVHLTRNRQLVAASPKGGRVYGLENPEPVAVAEFDPAGEPPIALVGTDQPETLALVGRREVHLLTI